jgi:hypothetical protein
MQYFLIACDIFVREISYIIATSPSTINVKYLEKGLHERPDYLREVLQSEIDQTNQSEYNYDAVLLAYALCGNSTKGIIARDLPVVIPKAHDCITLFLGSRRKYLEEFNNHPGTYYYTPSAVERGSAVGSETNENLEKKYKEYLAKYGEENAQYLMEIEEGWMKHYSYAASVDFELFRFLNYHGKVKDIAQKKSLQYREIAGDLNLLKKLLNGDWNHHEFLILQPGQKVEVTNDESVIAGVDIQE